MKKQTQLFALSLAAATTAFAQTVIDGSLTEVTAIGSDQYVINQDYTFPSEVVLVGTTYVDAGVTLTINPGTIVRGQPAVDPGDTPGSIVVSRGGLIDAQGTVTNPIIMTTAANDSRERWTSGDAFLDADPKNSPLPPFDGATGNSALWGALTLCGYAPTNLGSVVTGVAGENYVEGFATDGARNTYGGVMPNDNSGIVRYVSIRHSGRTLVEGEEQQGLTLAGVGAGTLIEYIDIYCSGDDGIEIFGGSANLRNVMISYVNDDGFDLDQGWTGNAQNVFILASNLNGPGNITTGSVAEWDGEDGKSDGTVDATGTISFTGQTITAPTMYNFTFFCEGVSSTAVTIDTNFGGNLYNSIFVDMPSGGFSITDNGSGNPAAAGFNFNGVGDRLELGTFNIDSVDFCAPASSGLVGADLGATALADGVIANTTAVALNSTVNRFFEGQPYFMGAFNSNTYNDQAAANGVNPVPITQATTNVTPVVGPFFNAAPYRGAFPQSTTQILFTTGWTAMNVRGILVDAANLADIL